MSVYQLERAGLARLIEYLTELGYRVVGPTLADGALSLGPLDSIESLPAGWGDEQAPGHYRLRRRDDAALFGYAVGAQGPKREFLPPTETLWEARRQQTGGFTIEARGPGADSSQTRPLALIGARACELAAVAIQDRVLLDSGAREVHYAARRDGCFVVAVHCLAPAATCFCTSVGGDPRATRGFDLALTELLDAGQPSYLVEVGSPRGAEVLAALGELAQPAEAERVERGERELADARARIGARALPAQLPSLLAEAAEHPRWREVAERCLACSGCTMVCPTCFCTSLEDDNDLDGQRARRVRRWASCFEADFSYIHGGSVRPSIGARYRQWLTHKLSSWHEQFDSSGCVGCGRCVTWCPVGIDIADEASQICGDLQ